MWRKSTIKVCFTKFSHKDDINDDDDNEDDDDDDELYLRQSYS